MGTGRRCPGWAGPGRSDDPSLPAVWETGTTGVPMTAPADPLLSERMVCYGADEPPPGRIDLAGPLAVVFEAGDLREIKLGGVEVVRRVYLAVRDRMGDRAGDGLRPRGGVGRRVVPAVPGRAPGRGGRVRLAGVVRGGGPSGEVVFEAEGEASSTFLRNRVGVCVHHPIDTCAGRPCRVERNDGTTLDAAFPSGIAPQGVRDVRAMSYEVSHRAPGRAEVRGRGVRDGGPAELDRRLVQDLPERTAGPTFPRRGWPDEGRPSRSR